MLKKDLNTDLVLAQIATDRLTMDYQKEIGEKLHIKDLDYQIYKILSEIDIKNEIIKEYLSDKQIDEIDYKMLANSIIAKAKRREQFVDKLYYAVCEQIYDMAKKKEEDYEDSIQAMFDKNKK